MRWSCRDGELVDRHDEVYFDMLGEVLERLIDDGRWRLIDVSVIGAETSRRRRAVPALLIHFQSWAISGRVHVEI